MTTSQKIFLSAGCVFLAAALSACLFGQHKIRQHRWTVLEMPVRIESGFALEHPFTVDVAADYFVEVECRKTLPVETLDSLLTNQLAVSYSVTEDVRQLAGGDSKTHRGAVYSQDYISRFIGRFPCSPGHSYHLTLRVARTLPDLTATTPVAKVSVTPIVFKNAYVTASLSAYLAIGLGIVGVLCIAPPLRSKLLRHRYDKDRT